MLVVFLLLIEINFLPFLKLTPDVLLSEYVGPKQSVHLLVMHDLTCCMLTLLLVQIFDVDQNPFLKNSKEMIESKEKFKYPKMI